MRLSGHRAITKSQNVDANRTPELRRPKPHSGISSPSRLPTSWTRPRVRRAPLTLSWHAVVMSCTSSPVSSMSKTHENRLRGRQRSEAEQERGEGGRRA
eukprot:305965-Pleurochrysis_carterae.AAC.1